jgi:phospholipid-binding lipoprotein MlaA
MIAPRRRRETREAGRRRGGVVLFPGLLQGLCSAAFLALLMTLDVVAATAQEDDQLFDELESEYDAPSPGFPDPLEPFNRYVLAFNEEVDQWVLDPITRVYRFILPDQVKRSIQRALTNLNSPGVTINDALQCEFEDAGITLWRFVVNSTFGIAGLFDPAAHLGVPGHSSDFDQTLAIYGVPSGAFLMLPVFGPTTVRGGFGTIVDIAFRPTTYFLAGTDQFVFTIIHGGSSGIATREASLDAIEDLQESSVDYYASLRNAYYQKRMADIWWRRDRNRERDAAADAN